VFTLSVLLKPGSMPEEKPGKSSGQLHTPAGAFTSGRILNLLDQACLIAGERLLGLTACIDFGGNATTLKAKDTDGTQSGATHEFIHFIEVFLLLTPRMSRRPVNRQRCRSGATAAVRNFSTVPKAANPC
jgi:hypothetical protein